MSQQVPPESGRGYPPPGGGDGPREDRPVRDDPFASPAPGDREREARGYDAPAYDAPPYGAPGQGAPPYGAPGTAGPSGAPGATGPYDAPPYGTPYGQPGSGPGAYGAPQQRRNGLGTAALVLGVLALLSVITVITFPIGTVLGLVAIVLGVMGRRRVKRGEATNGGAAIAGVVLGVVSLLIGLALFALVGAAASMFGEELGGYQECLVEAGDNQTAIAQCAADFQESVVQQQG